MADPAKPDATRRPGAAIYRQKSEMVKIYDQVKK